MNNSYIKNYDLDKLAVLSLPYFENTGIDTSDLSRVKKILSAIRVYLNKLDEIREHVKIFVQPEVQLEKNELKEILAADTSRKVFEALINKFNSADEIDSVIYKNILTDVQKETGVKGKLLFKPLRIALTGSENGPELPAIAEIFGKEKVITLLKKWI